MTQTAPEQSTSYDERLSRAHKRADELRGFYVHLMIYLTVNTGLFLIDLISGDGWWFFWPMLGWGIGLGAHAVGVFAGGHFDHDWENRKVDELMRRDEEHRG